MPSKSLSASPVPDGMSLSFEQALTSLQEIVAQLESGALTLEQTIVAFREGSDLAAHCQRLIADAELRITTITDVDDAERSGLDTRHAPLQIPGL